MLAAHHLEYAASQHTDPLCDETGIMVYSGSYKQVEIALVSTGSDSSAVIEYVSEAKRLGITEILYIGECVSFSRAVPLRTVVLAEGGAPALLHRAILAAKQYKVPVSVLPLTHSGENEPDAITLSNNITNNLYERAGEHGISTLSILTVSANTETGENMEEHERRSRLYQAARLVFETAALSL